VSNRLGLLQGESEGLFNAPLTVVQTSSEPTCPVPARCFLKGGIPRGRVIGGCCENGYADEDNQMGRRVRRGIKDATSAR
jgi:hypothetical protein